MNGDWYPWSEQVNTNQAGEYVTAWRHVVDAFTANDVRNVIWCWCPNVPYPGSTPLAALFPGDASVDRVAVDGYNWSTFLEGSTWRTFRDIFQPAIPELQSLTTKPLRIGEVAFTEIGGDKAAWIKDMFATITAHRELRGLTWFNYEKETDWRIQSSAGSLDSFRAGLMTH